MFDEDIDRVDSACEIIEQTDAMLGIFNKAMEDVEKGFDLAQRELRELRRRGSSADEAVSIVKACMEGPVGRLARVSSLAHEAAASLDEVRPAKGMEGEGPGEWSNDPRYVSNQLIDAHNNISDAHASILHAIRGTSIISTDNKKKLMQIADMLMRSFKDIHGIRREIGREHKLWSDKAMRVLGTKY